MAENEFTKRDKELAKKWRNLPPTDNFIFGKMFSDERLCKTLLEHLLHIKIKELTLFPQSEKMLQAAHYSRGIRLDVYAEDSDRVFDVEIQTADRPALPLRVRYYQGTLDTALLKRGELYSLLKESYIIFLCTFDPMKLGLPTYEFQVTLKGRPDVVFDDKRHIMLYNISAYEGERDSAIRDVLEFFATQKRGSRFGRDAGERLDEIKSDENWRLEYMTFEMALQDARYDGRNEGIAIGEKRGRKEGAHETTLANARNFKKLGVSEEIIAQATGLSLAEVTAL